MGDILSQGLKIKIKGVWHTIKPVQRGLIQNGRSFSIDECTSFSGGLIVGEGDSGKTTFVHKLFRPALSKHGIVEVINLRESSSTRESIFASASQLITKRKEGLSAILILDGLDEKPDLAQDIIDLGDCEEFESLFIWVTSRACNAASRLQQCSERFSKCFVLSEFNRWKFLDVVRDVGLDPKEFDTAVERAGLMSFMAKPGGAVFLLRCFANDRLCMSGRLATMDMFAHEFGRESRGGHTMQETSENNDVGKLVEAAEWISTCLFLTGAQSIWLGESSEAPSDALLLKDIPDGKLDRKLINESLRRRLFEPLNSDQLRLTYADMPFFLSGSWIAKNLSLDALYKIIPPNDEKYVTNDMYKVISWAGQRNPEFCKEWVLRKPEMFFACHKAIESIGIARYFSALVKLTEPSERFFNDDSHFHDHVSEFDGYEEFRLYSLGIVNDKSSSETSVILASFLLRGFSGHKEENALAITNLLIRRNKRLSAYALEWISSSLLDICGANRYSFLSQLKGLIPTKRNNTDIESYMGNLLALLWPSFIDAETLKDALNAPPLFKNLHTSLTSFILKLPTSYNISWIQKAQDRERELHKNHSRKLSTIDGKSFPLHSRYLKLLQPLIATDKNRAMRSLYWIRKKHFTIVNHPTKPLTNDELITFFEFLEENYAIPLYLGDETLSEEDETKQQIYYRFIFMIRDEIVSRLTSSMKELVINRLQSSQEEFLQATAKEFLYEYNEHHNKLHLSIEALKHICLTTDASNDSPEVNVATLEPAAIKQVEEAVRIAQINKGGRPTKVQSRGYTQSEMAKMFGKPCTVNKIHNWEKYDPVTKKGSKPPSTKIDDQFYIYTTELRTNPTEKNQVILHSIIEQYKSTEAVRQRVKDAPDTVHPNSPESFSRMKEIACGRRKIS